MTSARDTAAPEAPLVAPLSADAAPSPLLAMAGITKRFGTHAALCDVDFEARAGEIHALLGENGAGKSTLMHILSGLTRPNEGEIRLNGKAVVFDSPRAARTAGIAMVHQHFTLVPAFTVGENLALDDAGAQGRSRRGSGYWPNDAARAALDRAAALGWTLEPNARVGDLSVGAQQRVEIVKALATQARLLIFDEPTAVLAGGEVEELFAVLRRLRDEGCAVILIAHKLDEILAVADRVTVLRRGERVASAPVGETNAALLAQWMIGATLAPTESASDAPASPPPFLSCDAPVFVARDLVASGDRGEPALRGLSLTVRRGEIYGIGGVDGNGQTELAEVLVGLRPLSSGSLAWEAAAFAPGKLIRTGYIPQDRRRAGLAVSMSVEENLLFDAVRDRQYRVGPFVRRRALHRLADGLIAQFDIRTPGGELPASALSGGNQQKIVVARALHAEPQWIVAVNPTRGLDIGATRFVHEQLRAARDRGAAIVLISTDLDELAALADRSAILSGGLLTEYERTDGGVGHLGLLLGGVRQPASHPNPASAEARR